MGWPSPIKHDFWPWHTWKGCEAIGKWVTKPGFLKGIFMGSVETRVREWRPVVTTRNLTLQGMKFQHCFLRHLQSQGFFSWKSCVFSIFQSHETPFSTGVWIFCLPSKDVGWLCASSCDQTCHVKLVNLLGPAVALWFFWGFVRELWRGFLLLTWTCLLSKQADFAPTDCTYTRLS